MYRLKLTVPILKISTISRLINKSCWKHDWNIVDVVKSIKIFQSNYFITSYIRNCLWTDSIVQGEKNVNTLQYFWITKITKRALNRDCVFNQLTIVALYVASSEILDNGWRCYLISSLCICNLVMKIANNDKINDVLFMWSL